MELCKENNIDWNTISKTRHIDSWGKSQERQLRMENIASLIPFYINKQKRQFTIDDIKKQVKENVVSI